MQGYKEEFFMADVDFKELKMRVNHKMIKLIKLTKGINWYDEKNKEFIEIVKSYENAGTDEVKKTEALNKMKVFESETVDAELNKHLKYFENKKKEIEGKLNKASEEKLQKFLYVDGKKRIDNILSTYEKNKDQNLNALYEAYESMMKLGRDIDLKLSILPEIKKELDKIYDEIDEKLQELKIEGFSEKLYNEYKRRADEILVKYNNEKENTEFEKIVDDMKKLNVEIGEKLEELRKLEKKFKEASSSVYSDLEELEKLEKLKKLKKGMTYVYRKEYNDISFKIHNGDSKFKIKTATARMNDLDRILKGELDKYSSEFKSLEELKKEKLEENETKESKVKNYIKAKIGNARYFEAEVVKYSEWYKGKNEFIPLGEMREIYGTKGALMMICRLEDGSVKNKKLFSTYRRFCKKILENYRSLKVEAAIAALEGDEISASSFKEEDAKELNSMLHELNNLMGKDTSKFPLANPKDKKFNLSKFFLSTKSQIAKLKNTKGEKNKKRKELIDKVIKKIRKIESQSPSDSFNIDASMEREEYIKKYDNFVSESAELAVTYLKTEGKIKIQRFASQGKKKVLFEFKIFNKERDLAMDACKVALMCLVAVCSKDKKHITEGKKYFRNVKKYLNKYIG